MTDLHSYRHTLVVVKLPPRLKMMFSQELLILVNLGSIRNYTPTYRLHIAWPQWIQTILEIFIQENELEIKTENIIYIERQDQEGCWATRPFSPNQTRIEKHKKTTKPSNGDY